MTVKSLMKSSGAYASWAALAVGIAAMALPASASAQDSRWRNRSGDSQTQTQRSRPSRQEAWSGQRQQSSEQASPRRQQSSEQAAPRRNRSDSTAQSSQRIRRVDPSTEPNPWVRRAQNDANQTVRQQRGDRQRSESYQNTQRRSDNQTDRNRRVESDRNRTDRTWTNRDGDRRWDADRNRRVDRDYNRQYNRDDRYRNRDNRYSWNNDWRRDNRYNWYGYRNTNRNVFRLGAYYSPYRNWSYRRLSIGFFLDPLFYGSNYWLDDPWMYRLPPAYGPYRWVRYYDDALLVDIYTGEVIDVIYDFFW